jgi:hypothetical protein
MAVGDTMILSDGRIEEVISETVITGYVEESKEEEKLRMKKGLPLPMYSYVAVLTKRSRG